MLINFDNSTNSICSHFISLHSTIGSFVFRGCQPVFPRFSSSYSYCWLWLSPFGSLQYVNTTFNLSSLERTLFQSIILSYCALSPTYCRLSFLLLGSLYLSFPDSIFFLSSSSHDHWSSRCLAPHHSAQYLGLHLEVRQRHFSFCRCSFCISYSNQV